MRSGDGRYNVSPGGRGRRLLAHAFLALALILTAGPAAAFDPPKGYVTLVNGGAAEITAFTATQQANVRYLRPGGGLGTATVPLTINKSKLAAALARWAPAMNLWGSVAFFAFSPTMAGVDCGFGENLDPFCDLKQRAAEMGNCVEEWKQDHNGAYQGTYNFVCVVQQWSDGGIEILTTKEMSEICKTPVQQAFYNCYGVYHGRWCNSSDNPVCANGSKHLWRVGMNHPYSTRANNTAPGSDTYMDDPLTNPWGMSSWGRGDNTAGAMDADNHGMTAVTQANGTIINRPTGPLVLNPGQTAPGWSNKVWPTANPPVVPDVWEPVTVPEVEINTPVTTTTPTLPDGFNTTTNPNVPDKTNPWTNPGEGTGEDSGTGTTPGGGTTPGTGTGTGTPTTTTTTNGTTTTTTTTGAGSVTTQTNVDVDVDFPDEMDVRCIEGCGIEFQGLEGNDALPSKTVNVGTLNGESFLGGSCPGGQTVSVMGASFDIDTQPICDGASMLKGYVIGMSMLAGLMIVIGGLK